MLSFSKLRTAKRPTALFSGYATECFHAGGKRSFCDFAVRDTAAAASNVFSDYDNARNRLKRNTKVKTLMPFVILVR